MEDMSFDGTNDTLKEGENRAAEEQTPEFPENPEKAAGDYGAGHSGTAGPGGCLWDGGRLFNP